MTILVGLCGPEGAGKSTAARAFSESHPGRCEIFPFAAPLKRMVLSLGLAERHVYGAPADKEEPLDLFDGRSARHALQTLGTEWGRNCISLSFWVNAWLMQIGSRLADTTKDQPAVIVADDLRFPNEAEEIRKHGGYVFCVLKSIDDLQRVPRHASENFKALIDAGLVTAVIFNDGTPKNLADKMHAVIGSSKPVQAVSAAPLSQASRERYASARRSNLKLVNRLTAS